MSKVCDRIKKKRKIKQITCDTYLSSLRKLKRTITGEQDVEPIDDTKFLRDFDKTMKAINKENKLSTKKTKLTAVLVALDSDEKRDDKLINNFQTQLKKWNEEYLKGLRKQTKTDTQKKNWTSYDSIVELANTLNKELDEKGITKAKAGTLSNTEFKHLQNYVLLRTYLAFPLRNDFSDMKVLTKRKFSKLSEEQKKSKNFLVTYSKNKKEFVLNAFKNVAKIGPKTLPISPSLNRVINLWLKHNKAGWYLVKTDRKTPVSPNGLTKMLNALFMKHLGKKISSSMLRHITISHMRKNDPTIEEKEKKDKELEDKFLHSGGMNDLYRKVDN